MQDTKSSGLNFNPAKTNIHSTPFSWTGYYCEFPTHKCFGNLGKHLLSPIPEPSLTAGLDDTSKYLAQFHYICAIVWGKKKQGLIKHIQSLLRSSLSSFLHSLISHSCCLTLTQFSFLQYSCTALQEREDEHVEGDCCAAYWAQQNLP